MGLACALLDLMLAFTAFLLLYLARRPARARTLATGLRWWRSATRCSRTARSRGSPAALSWSELLGRWEWPGPRWRRSSRCRRRPEGRQRPAAGASPWSWRATLGVVGVGTVTLAVVSTGLVAEWHASQSRFRLEGGGGLLRGRGHHHGAPALQRCGARPCLHQLHGSNQRLEETVAERTRQLHVLHEIVRAATSSLDVSEVLGQILHRTAQALSADATAVWLLDGQEGYPSLQLHAQSGFESPEHRALLGAIPPRWGRGLATMLGRATLCAGEL